ncbi:MAG: tetratricopeptide repeat protein [bacterium]|nr:tetratricopeptide repeat protein [bacterium]
MDNQRRVLRQQSWVRDPASLRRYLEQLDGLRFGRVADAAALAETVAVEIVGGVIGPPEEPLELMCHAIGAFGAARRIAGKFATAARALGFALRLAGRHGLVTTRAGLLQRGAYVLRDAGFFDHALDLLDEAVVLWAEQGRSAEIGKTLVDRAIIFGHKEEFLRADRAFKIGMGYLSGDTETHRMFRLAAAHGIAFTQLRMGDTQEAERWLQRAIELVSDDEPTALAKLIRQKGEIYYTREQFPEAERAFASAHRILAVKENAIQGAYAAFDLAAALEAQGKFGEIKELAESMIPMLALFDDNRLAGAALLAFIRAAQDGSVTEGLIAEVGRKLGQSRPLARARDLSISHPDR